jgi:serine/threonine-protein kinase
MVEREIFRTDLSELWKVRNKLTGQDAALKIIAEELMQNQEMMQRFIEEIRLLTELRYEHVPASISFFPVPPRYAVVTRWVDGVTVADRVDANPNGMEIEEVVRISLPILRTLDQMHRQPKQLIHRDIKPLNVMVEKTGKPFLIDFGIALVRGNPRLSRAGGVIGTPEYMAPEMIQRQFEESYSVDIYAYGIMLFEMLTGRKPYYSTAEGMTRIQELQQQHIYSTPPLVGDFRADISDQLEFVVQKAIEKNPIKRWASCGEMADQLALAIEDPNFDPEPWKRAERRPGPAPRKIKEEPPPPPPPPPPAVPRPRSVSKWLAILFAPGGVFAGSLPYIGARMEHPEAELTLTDPLLLLLGAGFAVSFAAYLWVLYGAWKVIQDAQTRATPGGVVREHFYFPWTPVAVWRYFAGYGQHYNKYVDRTQMEVPYIGSMTGNFFVLIPFLAFLILFIDAGREQTTTWLVFIFFAQLFLFALMIGRMCDAINDMRQAQAEDPALYGGEAPAQ